MRWPVLLYLCFFSGCVLCPDHYVFSVRVETAPDSPARDVTVFVQCVLADGTTVEGSDDTGVTGFALISIPAKQECAAVRRTFHGEVEFCLFVFEDPVGRTQQERFTGADLDVMDPAGDDDPQLHSEIEVTFPE